MKKLISFAGACLLVGCLGTTEPKAAVLVLATATPTSIHAQETVAIDLNIFNNGTKAVQVALDNCTPPYEVITANGTVVGPGARLCTLDIKAPVTIEPQASVQFSTSWEGDSAGPGPGDQRVYLKPGSYSIRPRVNVLGDAGGFSYGAIIPVTITP